MECVSALTKALFQSQAAVSQDCPRSLAGDMNFGLLLVFMDSWVCLG